MNSQAGLITRLMQAMEPDRRLDAEVFAAVLAPKDCIISAVRTVDGWDIIQAEADGASPAIWMEAADVPRLTQMLGDAISFCEEVAPERTLPLLQGALGSAAGHDGANPTRGRVSRIMVAETLRATAPQCAEPAAQAA